MRKFLAVVFFIFIMCDFVVGVSSEIEANFVVGSSESVDAGLSFWQMHGDFFVMGLIVLIVVVVYLKTIKSSKKKRRK